MTTTVVPTTSVLAGQLVFFISTHTSRKKSRVRGHHSFTGTMFDSLASLRSNVENRLALAGVEGFEPPTYGFGDRRSTNSSYTPEEFAIGDL